MGRKFREEIDRTFVEREKLDLMGERAKVFIGDLKYSRNTEVILDVAKELLRLRQKMYQHSLRELKYYERVLSEESFAEGERELCGLTRDYLEKKAEQDKEGILITSELIRKLNSQINSN